MKSIVFLLVSILFLSACSDSNDSENIVEPLLSFEPCGPLVESGRDGECATAEVPLDWDDELGDKIDVFVKRYPTQSEVRGDFWYLPGGPGSVGSSEEATGGGVDLMLDSLAEAGWQVYIIQHRGTSSASTRLSCPEQEASDSELGTAIAPAEVEACGQLLEEQWGDLRAFTAWQAANDLGAFIADTQSAEKAVAVYGISYGTHVVLKYLQSYPEQADAILMDGVLPLNAEVWFNELEAQRVALREYYIGTDCAMDAVCGAELGPDHWGSVLAARDAVTAGSCVSNNEITGLSPDLFGVVLNFGIGSSATSFVPAAMIKRLARCSDTDQTELINLANFARGLLEEDAGDESAAPDPSENPVLGLNGQVLDMMEPFLDRAKIADQNQRELLVSGLAADALFDFYDDWPVTPRRNDDHIYAESSVPMLILNGTYDTATPSSWAQRVARIYSGNAQNLLLVPYTGHGVLPIDQGANGSNCIMDIVLGFIEQPQQAINSDCVEAITGPDFAAATLQPAQLQAIFGTTELWGTP